MQTVYNIYKYLYKSQKKKKKTQTTKILNKIIFFFTFLFIYFFLLVHLFDMGFGPLGTSCSLALNIFSCHGIGDPRRAPNRPFLRAGGGTWIALSVATGTLWRVDEKVSEMPMPCLLVVINSMAFLLSASLILMLLAIVEWNIIRRKKRVIQVDEGDIASLAMQNMEYVYM